MIRKVWGIFLILNQSFIFWLKNKEQINKVGMLKTTSKLLVVIGNMIDLADK